MKIQEKVKEEIKSEISFFLENHDRITSSEKESLDNVPCLFEMLNQLYMNTELSLDAHQKVSAAIRYINSGYDFLPSDISGTLGSVDDIMVAAMVLNKLNYEITLDEYCDKTIDLKIICSDLISLSDRYLPNRVTQKIRRDFG